MSPRVVDTGQRKLQIIGSAYNVFRERGYEKTKMVDIAQAAGMGKGTIYEYFNSKEELASQTIETMITLSQSAIISELDSVNKPDEKLRRFIEMLAEYFGEVAGVFRLLMEVSRSQRSKGGEFEGSSRLSAAYEKMIGKVQEILEQGIEKGVFREVDTRSTSALLVSIMDGLQLPYALDEKSVDVKKVEAVVEEMVFKYLT